MLTTLLTGLRDFRTPLAVGYLWLVALWLAFHNSVPPRTTATGLPADVYQLVEVAGRPLTLASLSLVAYLIGAMLEVAAARLIRPRWLRVAAVTKLTNDTLSAYIRDRTNNANRPHLLDEDKQVELREKFLSEVEPMAVRLQSADKEISADQRRAATEADFRANMGLSLLAVVIVLGWRYTPLWGIAALFPILLIARGIGRLRTANDLVVQAAIGRTGGLYSTLFEEELNAPEPTPDEGQPASSS
ncbi:hypothetical protein [Kitasatospora sp. NPDC047058]|uniref:hypothetical protein n=1 Tax=Kitasatospora sp. NPDC047058 TaxID=3155620 RepID=UPI0033CFC961